MATLSEIPAAATYSAPAYEAPAPAAPTYTAPAYKSPTHPSVPVVQQAQDTNFATAFSAPAASVRGPSGSLLRAPRKVARTVRVALPAAKPVVARTGSHLVQLGSFSSPQGARRGWGVLTARNPNLREYRMVITPAVVNGRNYWRVAAAGFDSGSALGMCSSVKNRGGVCFAYASNRAPAGALPGGSQGISGPQMARRR